MFSAQPWLNLVQIWLSWKSATGTIDQTDINVKQLYGAMQIFIRFWHHLLTLMSFQTCVTFFLLWNIKGDILMNVGNQTVLLTLDFHWENKQTLRLFL